MCSQTVELAESASFELGWPSINMATLQDYLKVHIPGLVGSMTITPVSAGQSNPTYFVSFRNRHLVLRMRPPGPLLPSAHAVDREFRVLKALSQTSVPVPGVILYEDKRDVVGTDFYVMERLDGRVFNDCVLPAVSPGRRREMYFSVAKALAKLHSVEPAEVDLSTFGRAGNYFVRQYTRWSDQWAASPSSGSIANLETVVAWLAENLPEDDGLATIVHGDFRIGNMMFHPSNAEVVGILDWELSTLGNPAADLAFCCLAWHLRPDEFGGVLGLDLESLGIPTQSEFVAEYAAGLGRSVSLTTAHIVFALFRFAVIFVGIVDRARAGNAVGPNTQNASRIAESLANRAVALINGEAKSLNSAVTSIECEATNVKP